MSETIVYWNNHASDAYPLRLTLSESGDASLEKPANSEHGAPSAGLYQAQIPHEDFAILRNLLTSDAMARLKEPQDVLPGECMSEFKYTSGSGPELAFAVAESFPPNPAFTNAETKTATIIRSVLEHPVAVVDLELRSPAARDGTISATVVVSSRGQRDILLLAPSTWENRGVQVLLEFRRNDVPLDEMGSQHQEFVTVTGDDIRFNGNAGADITVSAGASVSLDVEVQHALPAGSYDAYLYFESPLIAADGEELMTVDMEIGPVKPDS